MIKIKKQNEWLYWSNEELLEYAKHHSVTIHMLYGVLKQKQICAGDMFKFDENLNTFLTYTGIEIVSKNIDYVEIKDYH